MVFKLVHLHKNTKQETKTCMIILKTCKKKYKTQKWKLVKSELLDMRQNTGRHTDFEIRNGDTVSK